MKTINFSHALSVLILSTLLFTNVNCANQNGNALLLKPAGAGGGNGTLSNKKMQDVLNSIPPQLFKLNEILNDVLSVEDHTKPQLKCSFNGSLLEGKINKTEGFDFIKDYSVTGCGLEVKEDASKPENITKYVFRGAETVKWACNKDNHLQVLTEEPTLVDVRKNNKTLGTYRLNRNLNIEFKYIEMAGVSKKTYLVPFTYIVSWGKAGAQANTEKAKKTQSSNLGDEQSLEIKSGKLIIESNTELKTELACSSVMAAKDIKIIGISKDAKLNLSVSQAGVKSAQKISVRPNSEILMTEDKICGNKIKVDLSWTASGSGQEKKYILDDKAISDGISQKPGVSNCLNDKDFHIPGNF